MNDIAVIMCTYMRPETLYRSLTQLDAQKYEDFDVYLINNNPEIRDDVDTTVAEFDYLYVSVQHNECNRGAYARIEKMVELRDMYEWFMTIDDDMIHGPGLIGGWNAQRTDEPVVLGWQGWRFKGDYWDREAVSVGESCSYLWGGNMFIPTEAMADDGILALDQDYWNCEDIWLSYYVNHVLGMELRMGVSDVSVDVDGKDQYVKHRDLKVKLLNALRAKGWNV